MGGAAKRGYPFPLAWCRSAPVKGPAKAVLWALASRARANGEAYPGLSKLALESGVNRRTVLRALDSLEASGWIARQRRKRPDGRDWSSLYTLRLDRTDHVEVGCQSDTLEGQSDTRSLHRGSLH